MCKDTATKNNLEKFDYDTIHGPNATLNRSKPGLAAEQLHKSTDLNPQANPLNLKGTARTYNDANH